MESLEWTQVLLPLLTLALRLEGEGQYNLAKLARAAADALSRRAAYQESLSTDRRDLVEEVKKAIGVLPGLGLDEGLLLAFRRGAEAVSEGRLPLIDETPHPYVCRTCGYMALGSVTGKCPTCGAWPDTFQWFAPIYWLEALDPLSVLEKLRQTPLEVAALLEGLSEQAMSQPPQDGGWSIRNILSHLRDAQNVLDFRLGLFEREEHPLLESKAVFEWATREAERPPATLEIFASYKSIRSNILAVLESLPLRDWQRTGEHEEFGVVTLQQQVSYFAVHEMTHLPQIGLLRDQMADIVVFQSEEMD